MEMPVTRVPQTQEPVIDESKPLYRAGREPSFTTNASPTVDATGESFIGYYRDSELEHLAHEAGFSNVIHHRLAALNARYFNSRPDGLRLHSIE